MHAQRDKHKSQSVNSHQLGLAIGSKFEWIGSLHLHGKLTEGEGVWMEGEGVWTEGEGIIYGWKDTTPIKRKSCHFY